MKKRTKAYLALLTTLLYFGSAVAAVQETQARNVYTMNWNTVMDNGAAQVSSPYLVGQSAPELTILTGTMSVQEESRTITFPIYSGAATHGSLLWSTDEGELFDVSLAVNGIDLVGVAASLVPGENLVTITLTPSEQAKTDVEETQPAAVSITWTDGANPALTGNFQIMLENTPVQTPPTEAAEETLPEETTESTEVTEPVLLEDVEETTPEEPQPEELLPVEETAEAATEPTAAYVSDDKNRFGSSLTAGETTAPTEETEPETIEPETMEPETTQPTYPDLNAAEPTIPGETDPTTAPTQPTEETTVPTEETTSPTEESTVPETEPEETVPGETAEETEPSETEPEETEAEEEPGFRIASITQFSQSQAKLPVLITLEEGIDTVKLGMTSDTDGQLQPLPTNTRFSVNDGGSYYMMYGEEGYVAEFSIPTGIEELPVLLDFSQVTETLEAITLTAQGYEGKNLRKSSSAELTPAAETEVTTERLVLTEGETLPAEAWDTLFLTKETELKFTLPQTWADAELDYSIEILAVDDYGRVGYTPASTADGSLIISHSISEALETVTVTMGQTLPGAGTYRANFQWSYEGIPFAQKEVTFFINYSAYAEQAQSGQEVQDNE